MLQLQTDNVRIMALLPYSKAAIQLIQRKE